MVRLNRLVLFLLVFLSLAIAVARMIGSRYPSPLDLLFTYPDGSPCQRPCLFGIRTGETKAADAVSMLKSHPITREFILVQQNPFIVGKDGTTIAFTKTPDELVDDIILITHPALGASITNALNSLPEFISSGDMVEKFGSPDFVWIGYGLIGYEYISSVSGIYFTVPRTNGTNERFSVERPISDILVFKINKCPPASQKYVTQVLAGFNHYTELR